MPGLESAGHYKDVVLFLATAGVVAPLFKRMRISPVLGFLLAGVVLGPHVLGALAATASWLAYLTIARPAEFSELGELGVVFLLFMVGLELSWERLRLMRRLVFGLGAAQLASSAALLALAGVALGGRWSGAMIVGAALALSSTALVLPELAESRRLHGEGGRASFAVLLFQDLAVAPVLVTLSLIGAHGRADPLRLALAFAPSAAAIAALVIGGRLLLRPLLKSVARAKSEELFIAACLLIIIGAGVVASLSGLSMALGAFVAGLLLAETEFRHQVEVLIEPFKGLLLGVFFVSLGINLDLPLLIAHPAGIIGMTVGLIALKGLVVFALARGFGLTAPAAVESAFALAAAGEFAFVVLGQAMGAGLVAPSSGAGALLAVGLSMAASPALLSSGRRVAKAMTAPPPLGPDLSAQPIGESKVLIVGYGRVGRLVGEMMTRHEIAWLAVERDARLVEGGVHDGRDILFGDASRPELLRRVGLGVARALIVTMDEPETAEAVTVAARALRPDLTIVVRARDARHARRLYDLGANDAVPETVEASLQLSEAALVDIGVPMGLVIASIHERRDEFRQELNRPAAPGGGRRRLRDA